MSPHFLAYPFGIRKPIFYGLCMFHLILAQENDILFRNLSIEHGLSQSNVQSIAQDSLGFLWMGTESGLNIFDGVSFSYFNAEIDNPNRLSNSLINTLLFDRKGSLWVGTASGLNRINPRTLECQRFVRKPPETKGIIGNSVMALLEDRQGLIWVGTSMGLDRLDPADNSFFHVFHSSADLPEFRITNITALIEDQSGTLWIGTQNNGLVSLSPDRKSMQHFVNNSEDSNSLSHNSISSLREDHHQNLWIGTQKGLNRLDRKTHKWEGFYHDPSKANSLSDNMVTKIFVDKSGKLWIGTENGGLDVLNPGARRFLHYQNNPLMKGSLSSNKVLEIFQDRTGGLWIATYAGGVNLFFPERQKFKHYKSVPGDSNSISYPDIRTLFEDDLGFLWVGTDGGGLNKLDRKNHRNKIYRNSPHDASSLSDNWIKSFQQDREGAIWIGTTTGGLNKLDTTTGRFKHYSANPDQPNALTNNHIRAIHIDKDGIIWLGTFGGGLNKMDPISEKFTAFRNDPGNPHSVSSDRILRLYEDRSGTLWLATFGGGLSKLDKQSGTFTNYINDFDDKNSISGNVILSIFEDAQGFLWLGTLNDGLNRFDPKTQSFKHFLSMEGLVDKTIYNIESDAQGLLWMSSNRGIFRMNTNTGETKAFDVADGLQSLEFHTGAAFKSKKGELFFGGINGFNSFFPQRMISNHHIPNIVFTKLLISNKNIPIGKIPDGRTILTQNISLTKSIDLNYSDRVFTLEFAALDFNAPGKNQFSYRMEGLEKEWNFIGNHSSVTFTSIKPGVYSLHVKGTNNDGLWNEEGAILKIQITPPFWDTWWFFTMVGSNLCLITFFAVYFSIKRMQAAKEESERHQILDTLDMALLQGNAVVYRRKLHENSYEYLGKGFKEITGYEHKSMTRDFWGKICISIEKDLQVLPPLTPFSIMEEDKKLESGSLERLTYYYKILTAKGEIRWIMDTSSAVIEKNVQGTRVGVFFDITNLKLAEQKLAETFQKLQLQNNEMHLDLNMARELQMAFLAKNPLSFPLQVPAEECRLQFAYRYIPASALAGDFFWIQELSNQHVAVLICDVMGHGARASFLHAYLQGIIEELKYYSDNPAMLLQKLNQSFTTIVSQFDKSIYATAFYMVMDLQKKTVCYSNAGHPVPYILRDSNQQVEPLLGKDGLHQPALGILSHYDYASVEISLLEKDMIFLFTDGLYEVASPSGKMFGNKQLFEAIRDNQSKKSEEFLDSLLDSVRNFSQSSEFKDDVCMLTMVLKETLEPNWKISFPKLNLLEKILP